MNPEFSPERTVPESGAALPAALRVLVCPTRGELSGSSAFVGGGISNCPDWQSELIALCSDQPLTLVNPRRPDFPISDPAASYDQICWEFNYLREVKAHLFWFPREAECPITMFETGVYLMSSKPVYIGIHPEFPRRDELLAHIEAIRPVTLVVDNVAALARQVGEWGQGIGFVDLPRPMPPGRARSVFLRGGIRGCPDWQSEISGLLRDFSLEVVNPRRSDFVRGDSKSYRRHVADNYWRAAECEADLFWFPKESLTPVALLELGVSSRQVRPMFVGVHPEYRRRLDVEIQMKLARPEVEVVYSHDELAAQVRAYYRMRKA